MYSHQQYPFGGGAAWPFADSRGRSRRPSRDLYDLPLRGESPFDDEERLYADPRLQAARELEQQRLAQEYARLMRQQQQQRHRRQHPSRHFGGFVPHDHEEEDSDEDRDDNGLNGFGYVGPHVSEAQRQRAVAAAALRKQQQQQEYQQALERERKLREIQERRFLEQQHQIEMQKEQLRQRQAAQLAARQQKERDYIDYIRQLQQQADQARSEPNDDVEMQQHDQSDDEGEEERYVNHPLFGLVPERHFLRRSRSHSPPLRRAPVPVPAGYTLADLARAHALQQQQRNNATHKTRQQQQQQEQSQPKQQQQQNLRAPLMAPQSQAPIPIAFDTSTPQKPVAAPTPSRFTDPEAAALVIQRAVRGFLVRKQKILPKLKEIAKVRQTANTINAKYEGVTEKWAQVEKTLAQYRDSLPGDQFVFPEKRERHQVLIYEEEMLRALISLDNITAGRSEIVREARKKLVTDIQGYLNKLDHIKLIVKEINSLSEESTPQSSPSAPSTPVDSNSMMEVDSSIANAMPEEPATPVEEQQVDSEVEEPSEDVAMDDTPIETSQAESPQLSQEDISLLMRTLAANGLSIEDFRPSATPKQITLTTLAL